MRVPFSKTIQDMSGRASRFDGLRLIERLMLGLLILQLARLLWAVVTPVGAYGPWEGRQAQLLSPAARAALFSSFDPFFRAGMADQSGGAVVTSLALTLHGIRVNEGSGLGSAIIAGPDGLQNSFAVGDEIMPGVVLKGVAFDHVSIDRGGSQEQLFLDQTADAPVATPVDAATDTSPASATLADSPGATPTADAIRRDVGAAPRMQGGRVTGVVLTSRGPAFAAAGFQPGDIVTAVNGQPVSSDIQALQRLIIPGARLSFQVERGASTASINLILQDQ